MARKRSGNSVIWCTSNLPRVDFTRHSPSRPQVNLRVHGTNIVHCTRSVIWWRSIAQSIDFGTSFCHEYIVHCTRSLIQCSAFRGARPIGGAIAGGSTADEKRKNLSNLLYSKLTLTEGNRFIYFFPFMRTSETVHRNRYQHFQAQRRIDVYN